MNEWSLIKFISIHMLFLQERVAQLDQLLRIVIEIYMNIYDVNGISQSWS